MPALPLRHAVMVRIAERLSDIRAGTVYWTTPSLVTRELLDIVNYGGGTAPRLTDAELIEAGLVTPDDYAARGLDPTAEVRRLDLGPVLGVMRASGSTFERIGHHAGQDRPAYEALFHHMRLNVWGFVQATPAVSAGEMIEQLWQDHVAALLTADYTLGGLVKDLSPDGTMNTDDGTLEPRAYFVQEWLVKAKPIAARSV